MPSLELVALGTWSIKPDLRSRLVGCSQMASCPRESASLSVSKTVPLNWSATPSSSGPWTGRSLRHHPRSTHRTHWILLHSGKCAAFKEPNASLRSLLFSRIWAILYPVLHFWLCGRHLAWALSSKSWSCDQSARGIWCLTEILRTHSPWDRFPHLLAPNVPP